MKFDPKHLIAIEIVRREASLTRAAHVLGTSQPALSRTLSDLEIRIGAPLFDRRSRPWTLTRLGEGPGPTGRHGPARAGTRTAGVHELHRRRKGQAAPRGSALLHRRGGDQLAVPVPPRHHDVAFELSYGYGEELEDAVTSGRADVAIYPVGIGDLPPDLVFTPLIEATNVIVCRSGRIRS
jgi:DNA-binding transcriptional LysR family regulator